jgi:hypothetical protein
MTEPASAGRAPARSPNLRVLGPEGQTLTLADLPAPDTVRWVPSRKAIVVAAVRGGLIGLDQVCARYRLTAEELATWRAQLDRYGLKGLRTTQGQRDYR